MGHSLIWAFIAAMGIPSAVTGLGIFWLQGQMTKAEKKREKEEEKREAILQEKEEARQKLMLNILTSVNASIALGEATARAVERIPDANCNGDMHAALEYATSVKHQQKDYLTELGIKNIYEGE